RWEQIAALFIGFLLAVIAYDFLRDSVALFRNKETANFGLLAIIVTVVSVLVKEGLAQYAFFIARKTGNVSIKADGWHHRTDALSSLVVLVGILFAKKFWWIDSVLGAVIALMLFYATYEIVKEAIGKLLGEKPSEELISKLLETIHSVYDGDLKPHHFHIHNYVAHQELTFHIKLENSLSLMAAHKVATDIENKIYEAFGIIATVHIEPLDYKHNSD
ncbi:MAG TPA: cation diffusion facilitator family transporter, partial [Tenuifilaceae bacterium]|nr:cation diffusion facilitator family transporter [Tenuifilaceae bacterium]